MHARFSKKALVLAGLIGMAAGSTRSANSPQRVWGPAAGGIRMSISLAKPGAATQYETQFDLAFQNVGPQDVVLDLGRVVGNGSIPLPSAVQLTLVDPAGAATDLPRWMDVVLIKGRIDDLMAPLAAGAAPYVLRLDLDRYCKAPIRKLSAGRYHITATYEGNGPQFSNADTPDIASLNFWKGRVQSNSLEFDLVDPKP